MIKTNNYWEMRELVVIGVFAAVAKVSVILVSLVGGGMNPLSLILKNLLFTTLAIILLNKVRKFGTFSLYLMVNIIVSMVLMGGVLFLVPPMIIAGIAAEISIMIFGGYKKDFSIIVGVGIYDFLFKAGSIGISWIYMREQPEIIMMVAGIVIIGYLGAVIGLFTGAVFVKELRHACIIRT